MQLKVLLQEQLHLCEETCKNKSIPVKLELAVSQFEAQMPALELHFQFPHTLFKGEID